MGPHNSGLLLKKVDILLYVRYVTGVTSSINNNSDSKGSKVGGVGAGWIERELAAVKRSYEEEVRVLDAEVSELRAKLRQTTSYSAELRRRYEDSMKSVFRSGFSMCTLY